MMKSCLIATAACLLLVGGGSVIATNLPERTGTRILITGEGDNNNFEYVATTDVAFLLNLALDAAEMRNADSDFQTKKSIYYSGKNAYYEDPTTGARTMISLAGLSLAATGVMSADPMYNIFRNTYYDLGVENERDTAGEFDGHPVEEYANTLVMDLFELNSTRTETEGAIVLNVWMAVVHELYSILRSCKAGNPDNQNDMISEMSGALDRATALWIGADQIRGDNLHGHLLYNIAEVAGELFGQDEGESRINIGIMSLITRIQFNIASATCSSETGYMDMREKVHKVISFMTVPLVQTLIHHIVQIGNEGASDMVELYTLALLPRIAACDPATYKTMEQLMVFNSLTAANQQQALNLLQSVYSCLDVTCEDVGSYLNGKIPQCSDEIPTNKQPPQLAAYSPTVDVRSKSYIDRDLLQIRLLMEWEAYDAAKDYYLHGYNSFYSLAALAQGQGSPYDNAEYALFQAYNQQTGDKAVHQIILDVMDGVAPFADATVDQKVNVVMSLLQGVVMYTASLSELGSAITECEKQAANPSSGSQDTIMQLWDGGAAYYIGSIEGSASGGKTTEGQLLYGAAKVFCEEFKTCEPNDAAVNEMMLEAFDFGKQALLSKNCQQAKTVLEGTIQPAFYIPLVQGTVLYASKSKELVTIIGSEDFAALYGYSKSILPRFNAVDTASAALIHDNVVYDNSARPMAVGFDGIFNAVKNALNNMPTNCSDIGTIAPNGGLCLDSVPVTGTGTVLAPEPAPVPAAGPTDAPNTPPPIQIDSIAWGRYDFQSEAAAHQDALLSLDVRDIRQAGVIQDAEQTYVNGKNLENGLYGQVGVMSLSEISSEAHVFMKDDPIFNYFRFALYDESTFENADDSSSWPFADMVVRLALSPDHGNNAELAAEASVIMNVFFLIQHRLYRAARECKANMNPGHLIDSAVALWIGREQEQGKYNSGHMMYSIAQRAAQDFSQPETEAPLNNAVMDMFREAQGIAGYCQSEPNSFLELRVLGGKIIEKLSASLIQQLLYYMSEDNLDYTELYGLSVIPQAVSCDADVYQGLKSALIDSFSRDTTIDDSLYEQFAALLKCMRLTCEDLGDTSRAGPHLQEIVSNVCQKLKETTSSTALAGYVPTYDVSEESRIDLDIRQIDIFMRTRAYGAAEEHYLYGANSRKTPRTVISLQLLATTPERKNIGNAFSIYAAYFGGNDNYADSIIMAALKQQGDYEFASRLQLTEVVVRTLQSMVSYMAVLWMLNSAVGACRSGQNSEEFLDTGVAYFVGSIEGTKAGGAFGKHGELLYGLAKEECPNFDTCTDSGDANINKRIMSVLGNMQARLKSNDCDSANSVFNDVIMHTLPVAMIQGTLKYAATNEKLEARSTDKSVASGSILAGSVLPLVNAVNPTSATTIYNNMAFQLNQRPVSDGHHTVFNAFASSMNAMEIDCQDIGILRPEARGVCEVQQQNNKPAPDTPTNLGDDLYVTTTYVQDRANIAIDVKEMEEALKDGRQPFAELIYNQGKNSDIYDANGMTVGQRTMKDFSVVATNDMMGEPLFNLFVYALQDASGQYMGDDAKHYANTIVQDSFKVKSLEAKTLAAEAAVALNVWMFLAHILHQTLTNCRNGAMSGQDGVHSIDEAVAYWIGDGQVAGDSDRGHLLYALAEEMGEQFRMDNDGQSRTNTNILRLFHEAKIELAFPESCMSDQNTYKRLYHIVNKISSQMAIPLVQALIHNLRQNDPERVKVYAHAVVPLFSACSPSAFTYLRQKLIYSTFNVVEVEPIIDRILGLLPCLGLKCDDIGIHKSEAVSSCSDPQELRPLAGYKPASDVREYSQLDLDILEIDILMQMGAYKAAEDLYLNGKHTSVDNARAKDGLTTSLSFLATSPSRSVVPQYDSFVRYHDGDEKYADTIVKKFLTGEDYSPETRRSMVVRTCQYMIMFMAGLQGLNEAVVECEANQDTQNSATAEFWDKGAAFIIGHLEGTENGGSSEGELFFSLAKEHCDEFGTCSSPSPAISTTAAVNDKIVSLLYAGRGAVISRSCPELKKAAREIEPLLLVPLIQATLRSSLNAVNSGIRQKALSVDHVEAHVFATSVLPLVEDVDRNAAETIESNVALEGVPFHGGIGAIFESFMTVYGGLGLSCSDIGSTNHGSDGCQGPVVLGGPAITGIVVGTVIAILTICGIICLLRARKKADTEQRNNTFVRPKGELNHTDDLLKRAKERTSRPDDESENLNESNVEEADGDVV